MTDSYPLCKSAGLETRNAPDEAAWLWAADVEAFLKHLELDEFNYVGGKYFYVQPDKFNALKNAPKKKSDFEKFTDLMSSRCSGTVSDEWNPPKEDLEKIYKLCEKSMPKGDDPMPKENISNLTCEFFKPEHFDITTGPYSTTPQDLADAANRLLQERGTVVYGHGYGNPLDNEWHVNKHVFDHRVQALIAVPKGVTHQALLIDIRPIEKADTAEGLLKEIMDWTDKPGATINLAKDIQDRARKFLTLHDSYAKDPAGT